LENPSFRALSACSPASSCPLAERAGCFFFVALPLVFGLPVAMAWAQVLGQWFFYAYVLGSLGTLAFIVYVLEREDDA
jgi:hypothetical protein